MLLLPFHTLLGPLHMLCSPAVLCRLGYKLRRTARHRARGLRYHLRLSVAAAAAGFSCTSLSGPLFSFINGPGLYDDQL